MKWNPQQEKAIYTTDKNIVVSASAGAGKTTVLVARLMKRIQEDQIPVNRVLAMTFTEAAASEMKKRLLRSINEALSKQENVFLRQQLALIPNALITTIHSFCLTILKKYYYVLQLDPEMIINVLEESTVALYQAQALDTALKNAYQENHTDFLELLDYMGEKDFEEYNLRQAILDIAQGARDHLNPEAWFIDTLKNYQTFPSLKDLPEPILYYFFDQLQVQTETFLQAVNDCCGHVSSWGNSDITTRFYTYFDKCRPLLSLMKNHDYVAYRALMEECFDFDFPRSPISGDDDYSSYREAIQKSYDSIMKQLFSEEELLTGIALLQKPVQALVQLTKDYLYSYQELKRKNQAIDFQDMEHYAYQILRANNGSVAKIYQEQLLDIYVDEFQDTNETQNSIIELICRLNNVFRVGDVKQSIYRFRGAKPALMRSCMQEDSSKQELIYLRNNYRSKENIVQFNNALFAQLMNIEGTQDTYTEEDAVEIGIEKQQENGKAVEFYLLDSKEIKGESETSSKDNDIRAQFIANKIIELYQSSNQPHWRDYVVLVRAHALKTNLKKAFEEANIPHFISMPEGFYQSSSVQTVLAYLKILSNPQDDISLITVLKHFYHFSNDDLATLKLKKDKDCSYYDYLHNTNHPVIKEYQEIKDKNLTLTQLLNTIYGIEYYYHNSCNKQERTNLDLLHEKAASFQKKNSSILSFLDFIGKIEDNKTAEANSISADSDVVRVMTVHQSKGLEFPTVLFWSSSQQRIHDAISNVIVDDTLGIGLSTIQMPYRIRFTNPIRQAMIHKATKEELEEQIRLLYVALTRAMNHLIIIDNDKDMNLKPLTYSSLFQKMGYSGWIRNASLKIPTDLLIQPRIATLEPIILPQSVTPYFHLETYHGDTHCKEIISPSSTEMNVRKQTLSFATKGSEVGTSIHEIIEQLPNHNWSEALIKTLNPELSEYWIDALMYFYHTDEYSAIKNFEIKKELPFIARKDNQIIHGFMDMVATSKNECIMIDFKTDRVETNSALVERYSSQIILYKEALKLLYPNHAIKTLIYSFALKCFINI